MISTFYKWVLNAMTAPNPTQYTKFDKYILETQESKLVRNWVLGVGAQIVFTIEYQLVYI